MEKPIVKNKKMKKERMNVLYHRPIFLLVKIILQNGKKIHPEQIQWRQHNIFYETPGVHKSYIDSIRCLEVIFLMIVLEKIVIYTNIYIKIQPNFSRERDYDNFLNRTKNSIETALFC